MSAPLTRLFDQDEIEIAYGGYRPAEAFVQTDGQAAYKAEFAECNGNAGTVAKFSVDGGPLRDVEPTTVLRPGITPILYFVLAPA